VGIERVVKIAAETAIPDLHIRCPECFAFLLLRAVSPQHGLEAWSGDRPELGKDK
jgi:hypothetical protein